MNTRSAWILSVVAVLVCAELGRSMLRPRDVAAQASAQAVIAPAENLVLEGVAGVECVAKMTTCLACAHCRVPLAHVTGADC